MKCNNKACENYTEINTNHCCNMVCNRDSNKWENQDLTKCSYCVPLYTLKEIESDFKDYFEGNLKEQQHKQNKELIKCGFLLATRKYGILDEEKFKF